MMLDDEGRFVTGYFLIQVSEAFVCICCFFPQKLVHAVSNSLHVLISWEKQQHAQYW